MNYFSIRQLNGTHTETSTTGPSAVNQPPIQQIPSASTVVPELGPIVLPGRDNTPLPKQKRLNKNDPQFNKAKKEKRGPKSKTGPFVSNEDRLNRQKFLSRNDPSVITSDSTRHEAGPPAPTLEYDQLHFSQALEAAANTAVEPPLTTYVQNPAHPIQNHHSSMTRSLYLAPTTNYYGQSLPTYSSNLFYNNMADPRASAVIHDQLHGSQMSTATDTSLNHFRIIHQS